MMTSSVAEAPTSVEAPSPTSSEGASRSGRRRLALLVATVLTLGSVGGWGYTQWWVPQQQAEQAAQVKYDRCLDEVKVYEGTASYPGRVSQCAELYGG